eukprot:4961825-Prymnesium_polylepis.1
MGITGQPLPLFRSWTHSGDISAPITLSTCDSGEMNMGGVVGLHPSTGGGVAHHSWHLEEWNTDLWRAVDDPLQEVSARFHLPEPNLFEHLGDRPWGEAPNKRS